MKFVPELEFEVENLLFEVEKKFKYKPASPKDFEMLSTEIERTTGEALSISTLKRLWGYVEAHQTPRFSTLDILSKYVGFTTFRGFCANVKYANNCSSVFIEKNGIDVSTLEPGAQIKIGWEPNRVAILRYLGDFRFVVMYAENSQLMPEDEFRASYFALGFSLHIATVYRNGVPTTSYVAGFNSGLTMVKLEKS